MTSRLHQARQQVRQQEEVRRGAGDIDATGGRTFYLPEFQRDYCSFHGLRVSLHWAGPLSSAAPNEFRST